MTTDQEKAARTAERRAMVKKTTDAVKEAAGKLNGLAYYRINRPYYRKGTYFKAGAVVRLPLEEDPAKGWQPAEVDAKSVAMAPAPVKQADAPKLQPETKPEPPKGKRPSDREI